MNLSKQIAQHFRELHDGGNSTGVNYKDTLKGISWKDATVKINELNTIATLVYHTHYYVHIVLRVLEGGHLEGNDKLSFETPPITSQEDWDNLLKAVWSDADRFTDLIEQMSDEDFFGPFDGGKYGNNYRNIVGIIEHLHYHLGQIVFIKKLLQDTHT